MKQAKIYDGDQNNYYVEVENDNGQRMRILVPKDEMYWGDNMEEYGLNMVTRGHYE